MNRDEQIYTIGQDVYGKARLLEPLKSLGWTYFFNTKVGEAAERIAKKEIEAEWSPEFLEAGSSDDVAAFNRIPGASRMLDNLVVQSTRKGISEVAKKYPLLLAPEWKPDATISIDDHEAALKVFNAVYKAKLAELSVKDPIIWTVTRRDRKPGELHPEEVAYEEGEKAYDKKLGSGGRGGSRRRRRKTRKVVTKRRRTRRV